MVAYAEIGTFGRRLVIVKKYACLLGGEPTRSELVPINTAGRNVCFSENEVVCERHKFAYYWIEFDANLKFICHWVAQRHVRQRARS